MTKIIEIEGIGEKFAQKFDEAGVRTVEELLAQGGTRKGRKALAEKTDISEKQILRWVNHADLFRIKGVGEEYAQLLEAAGVDTIPELARRVPANLQARMAQVQAQKKLVRKLPVESQVADWVAQAKALPRSIEY